MRKGRFAGVGEAGEPASAPLGLGRLLLFDLAPPASDWQARIAAERARALAASIPFLAFAHFAWAAITLGALARAGHGIAPLAGLLGAVLLLDLVLWRALRRPGLKPHRKTGLAALYLIVTAGLWAAAVLLLGDASAPSLLARAALVCAMGAGIATFFPAPPLLVLSCVSTLTGIVLLNSRSPLAAVATAALLCLALLSVSRARDLIGAARTRLAAEWEARQARRFIDEYEQSGRGWFWETNAEAAVTYLSPTLERCLGLDEGTSIGRRFEELLPETAREALAYHLSARFPFADLLVRNEGAEEAWWSLSGRPGFDEYGRFLGFRGIGSNLSERERSEAESTKLARYDSLTGLLNRASMRATLDDALANAAERRQGCALLLIDLDRFKQVNDTLGHPVGDKLLRQVAKRLTEVMGSDGAVGRLGGDEFEAILPGVAEEGRLSEIAARLIARVAEPYDIDGHRVEVGSSVGIAVARPGKAYASALVRDADLALYAAKAAGRGTFRFFAPEMHAQATDRQVLENDLKDALAKDQLRLLFQPIVDTVTEEPVAFEALLRWHHPTRGILQPDLLVPLAEEAGMMPRIGAWVLRTACAEAAGWPDHVRAAVNLSAAQAADPGLPSIVTSALASSGLAPDRLELEIAEDSFPEGAAGTRILERLKRIGVRLALDNFGTGKSGFRQIRHAPLDKIKIDRSFVRGAEEKGSRNAAIIRAIVVMAEGLGMDVTAEGAETLEELALIRSLGCSQVQGFLFARPMAREEARAIAAASRPTEEAMAYSRPPRHRLIRMGVLHCDGEAIPVRLRNISAAGAMVECDRTLAPGTRIALELEDAGRLEAEARWSLRGQVGMRFDTGFELRRLSRPKAGAGGLKMLTPAYLDAAPAEEEEEPLLRARPPGRRGSSRGT
jgi:diguanylate cyclase (GGDEF)-like protein